jgi:hypothetical protein
MAQDRADFGPMYKGPGSPEQRDIEASVLAGADGFKGDVSIIYNKFKTRKYLIFNYVMGSVHLRHDLRYDLRFDLRFGGCVIKRLPCRGASHANAGTELEVES